MKLFGSALIPFLASFPLHCGLAQDVLREMPSLPTGFMAQDGGGPDLFGETDLTNLNGSVALDAVYNSNVNNGRNGLAGAGPSQADTIITPRLNLDYVRENREWRLGARASIARQQFLDEIDFNTTNYNINVFGGYQSRILVASFTAGYNTSGGVNRISGAFLEQSSVSAGLMARYRFSGLTSFLLSWNHSEAESQTSGFGDMSSDNVSGSVLWQATPLLSIGPGITYGVRSGNQNSGDFTVIGPTLTANYDLRERLKIRSSIGYNFSESDFGDSTQSTWSIAMDYRHGLWNMNLSMVRGTQATFVSGGGFDLSTAYRLGYTRRLGIGQLGLNASYAVREPEAGGEVIGNARDSEIVTLGASFSRPIFADRVSFNTNVSWNQQSASDDSFSWDGYSVSTGLSWAF